MSIRDRMTPLLEATSVKLPDGTTIYIGSKVEFTRGMYGTWKGTVEKIGKSTTTFGKVTAMVTVRYTKKDGEVSRKRVPLDTVKLIPKAPLPPATEGKAFPVGTKRKWRDGFTYVKQPDGSWEREMPAKPAKAAVPERSSDAKSWGLFSEYSPWEREVLLELKEKQREFERNGGPRGVRCDAKEDGSPASPDYARGMIGVMAGKVGQIVLGSGAQFKVPAEPPPIKLRRPKECFENATQLVLEDPDRYDYCEGFVVSTHTPIPIHHAWAVEKETGHAVDPTLGWRPNSAYFGIQMSRTELVQQLLKNKVYGVLTTQYGGPTDFAYSKEQKVAA